MENEITAKFVSAEFVSDELDNIGFDMSYRTHAIDKNTTRTIKVINLRPQEATILKQSALALGFDAAVNRGVLDCSVEKSDALLTGSMVQFEKLSQALVNQPFRMKQTANEINKLLKNSPKPIQIGQKTFDWTKPYVMGILNVTPDSFSDGGKFFSVEKAVEHFHQLVKDGADIVDIGAESTRPQFTALTPQEEIERLKPILQEIAKQNAGIPISVDTRNVETAKMALSLGADLINDVGLLESGEFNQKMIDFVNANGVPYIVMHNKKPEGPLVDSVYRDLEEVLEKITAPVIADIGIGFGKNVEQNFELVNRAGEFRGLGVPILVGHSRKSFISKTFPEYSIDELDTATSAVSVKLALDGVNILRVHDVKRTKIALSVFCWC